MSAYTGYIDEVLHLPMCNEKAETIDELIGCLDYVISRLEKAKSEGWSLAGSNECYSIYLVKETE